MKKNRFIHTLLIAMIILLTACDNSPLNQTNNKISVSNEQPSIDPRCDSLDVLKLLKYEIRKYIDPFNIGTNKNYSGIEEISKNLNKKIYYCKARFSYNYAMQFYSFYLEYTINSTNNKNRPLQIEITTIINNE